MTIKALWSEICAADMVGLGKTVQLALSAQLMALYETSLCWLLHQKPCYGNGRMK